MTDTIKNHTGGFTLIEAMIVVALIAIISAVAIPAWQSMKRNSDLKSAAFEIMSTVQWAKSEAAKRNICVGINFIPAACPPGQGNCYEIFSDDNANGGVACDHALNAAERALIGEQNKILRAGGLGTKARLNTDFPGDAVAVTPRGLLQTGGLPNGNVSLRPMAGDDPCYRLMISPTTGVRLNPGRWNAAAAPPGCQ